MKLQQVMKTKRRRLAILVVKSILSLIGVFAITVLVHEGMHYLTARVLNVPIAYFRWFDVRYFAPVIVAASADFNISMIAVSCAGGFVTGILFLMTVVLRRNWFRRSLYGWLLGLDLAMFGSWQISQGILEGAFHQTYIANAARIFSPVSLIGYIAGLVGFALYWLIIPRVRTLPL